MTGSTEDKAFVLPAMVEASEPEAWCADVIGLSPNGRSFKASGSGLQRHRRTGIVREPAADCEPRCRLFHCYASRFGFSAFIFLLLLTRPPNAWP